VTSFWHPHGLPNQFGVVSATAPCQVVGFVQDEAALREHWSSPGTRFQLLLGLERVVFCRDHNDAYVLDPKRSLKTNRRRDFGRMKSKWLIAVQGVPSAINTS
jgi:hypothetical protein